MDKTTAPDEQVFQDRVQPWMLECFGAEIAKDVIERNHRFLEESLELVQACGCPANEAHELVNYVYGRAIGEKEQEVGGVMVTLAALCLAQQLDMHAAGETELGRIWTKIETIRAKQAAKPAHSPLPAPPRPTAPDDATPMLMAADTLRKRTADEPDSDFTAMGPAPDDAEIAGWHQRAKDITDHREATEQYIIDHRDMLAKVETQREEITRLKQGWGHCSDECSRLLRLVGDKVEVIQKTVRERDALKARVDKLTKGQDDANRPQ